MLAAFCYTGGMETLPSAASDDSPKKRKRSAPRSVEERLADAQKKVAQLRANRAKQERVRTEKLIHLMGSSLLAMMQDDAALRATLTTQLLAQITRPADRELLQTWLASFQA